MKPRNYIIILLFIFAVVLDVASKKSKKKKPNSSKRIIEGVLANQADYPFIASLLYYGSHICGGSIVSDRVILTAAHCCFDPLETLFRANELSVAVGSSKWKSAPKLKVTKVITHQQYNPDKIINDVAIWVLKNQITDASHTDLVKLEAAPLNEQNNLINAAVLGWGFTSSKGLLIQEASEDLYMVNIYSVSLNECKQHFSNIGSGHICFTSPDRRGSCNGDSGGPLVMKKGAEIVQIGVVSFGSDCNNTTPEVYTRISAYYDWIRTNVIKARKQGRS